LWWCDSIRFGVKCVTSRTNAIFFYCFTVHFNSMNLTYQLMQYGTIVNNIKDFECGIVTLISELLKYLFFNRICYISSYGTKTVHGNPRKYKKEPLWSIKLLCQDLKDKIMLQNLTLGQCHIVFFIAWKKKILKSLKNKALTPVCQYWLEGTSEYDNDPLLVLRMRSMTLSEYFCGGHEDLVLFRKTWIKHIMPILSVVFIMNVY